MTPGARIRAGVIGVGFVGSQHVEALRRLGSVDVAAVVASTPERARAAAEKLGVAGWTSDYHDILGDPSIDVVHVCVPNDLHLPIARETLRAGKHVICEKPLAMDSREAAVLTRLAESTGRVSVLVHNYRFFPMAAELRDRVLAGELGPIHLIRGNYLQDWLLLPTDYNWRVDAVRGGSSRAVADIGSHWIDLAETVTGLRVKAVIAELATIHPQRRPAALETFQVAAAPAGGEWQQIETEDQAALLLRFEEGLQGTLIVSQVAAGHKNDLELSVDGAAASATWRQERPDDLWIGRRDGSSETVSRSPQTGSTAARALARLPAGHNEGWADGLRNLLGAAYTVIGGDRSPDELPVPLPTFRDGLHHHLFIEAALESARRGDWVQVPDEALSLEGLSVVEEAPPGAREIGSGGEDRAAMARREPGI